MLALTWAAVLAALLAPGCLADETSDTSAEWRTALRSEVHYGPAAEKPKEAPPAAAPAAKATADPNIVQMEPYTLQETRMNLPSVESAIETPGPRAAAPVKWGTGLHEAKLKHVTVFYYSLLFVPIAAGFSW